MDHKHAHLAGEAQYMHSQGSCLQNISDERKFCQPLIVHPKIYHALPLSCTDLDEVLAFIYIGPNMPTLKELKGMPMPVQHDKVKEYDSFFCTFIPRASTKLYKCLQKYENIPYFI